MCQLCAIAVAGGLGISRVLGVDDIVTSIWIGALILSLSFWLRNWLTSREKLKRYANIYIIAVAMYGLTLVPLYYTGTIGIVGNNLWGVDKIVLGTVAGSLAFLAGVGGDRLQRKKFGKQFFNYQKVVFPVVALLIVSLVFYLITK